jgi:hypothetical protein
VLDDARAPIVLYEANARSAAAFGQKISDATDFLRTLTRATFTIFHVQGDGSLLRLDDFRADYDHFNLLAVPALRMDRMSQIPRLPTMESRGI